MSQPIAIQQFLSWFDSVMPSPPSAEKPIVPLRQGHKDWANEKLGNSNDITIHGEGCTLVGLTMAATFIGSRTRHWPENVEPKNLTPLIANKIIRNAGHFTPGKQTMYIVGGAAALGMQGDDTGIKVRVGQDTIGRVNRYLQKYLVMAHVHYRRGWAGDHWILLTHKNGDGSYSAIDPAYGERITLYTSPDASEKMQNHVILYGRSSSISPKRENVTNYRVVRFVTLKPKGVTV